MDSTVAVAALGLTSTLAATWFTSRSAAKANVDGRILDARIRVYSECSEALYEYSRASFNRADKRLNNVEDRDLFRDEAYRSGARTKAAIGAIAILTGNDELRERLDKGRTAISNFTKAQSREDLTTRHRQAVDLIDRALDTARQDLSAHLGR